MGWTPIGKIRSGDGGTPGRPGQNGTIWLNDSGAPSLSVGNVGDYYLNKSTGDVYQKKAPLFGAPPTWGKPIFNLKGPQGKQGPQGLPGQQAAIIANSSQFGFRLIKITNLTAGTTFTPSPRATALYVECIGAGGGAGGCATAATNGAASAGGGGGAYSATFLFGPLKNSYAYSIGQGGTGGTGGANGIAGLNTTFDSPSVCTAQGGAGSTFDTVAAGPRIGSKGVNGGSNTNGVGDIKLDGCASTSGIVLAAAQILPGNGGAGPIGSGGSGQPVGGSGQVSGPYGGGGAGAGIVNGGVNTTGGNGAQGLIRIWEFAG